MADKILKFVEFTLEGKKEKKENIVKVAGDLKNENPEPKAIDKKTETEQHYIKKSDGSFVPVANDLKNEDPK
jgi:hypothetical protein